jgi:hypothetical protein
MKYGDKMKIEILNDYNELKEFCSKPDDKQPPSGLTVLIRTTEYIDRLDEERIKELVFMMYNKWPGTNCTDAIRRVAKRYIQRKYYQEIFAKSIPDRIIKEDEKHLDAINLQEERPQSINIVKQTKKNHKTEFSKRVSKMKLEQVIQWAQESGIPELTIKKHINKPIGLAKMNISNILKKELMKDESNQHLWLDPQEK